MPVTTTTTTTVSASTSLHTISWRGPSGICFLLILVAAFFYILGFSTNHWYRGRTYNEGLWESCTCGTLAHDESWFKATQAMITIGLICLIVCIILGVLYMFVHTPMVSKNSVIIALIIVTFCSVVFALIGLIIYGVERESPHWSYAMTVIGMIVTLAAGIVAVVQMRQSGVPCC